VIPLRGFLYTIGVAAAAALLIWGYSAYRNHGDKTPFQQKAEAAHDTTTRAEALVARTDTLWLPARDSYLTAKKKNADVPAAREVAVACDSALAAQDRRIAARDTLVGALHRELNVWQNKPGPQMVPVARVGVTARLVGPISLSAAGEYAAPRAGQSNPAFRANVGVRYNF
jgi:hypothetical protein